MDVKSINNVSQLGFEGVFNKKSKKAKHNAPASYPQADAPASKNSANAMRAMTFATLLAAAGAGTLASCSKDDWMSAKSEASASAYAEAYYKPIIPDPIHDTTTVVIRDTVEVPGPERHIIDSIPYPVEHTDTIYLHDSIPYPVHHTDTIYKYITEHDTIINTVIQPIPVKDAPWHVMDSLIRQGINVGVPLEGPMPKEKDNNVLFLGSKAYNEYDYKMYETQLDSIGTNAETLSLITKVTDLYDGPDNKKISYLKTTVVDVPGVGIKLDRFVMDADDARMYGFSSGKDMPHSSHFGWKYAGHEIRTNNRDGRTNTVQVYDKYDRPLGKNEYIKGNDLGSFLYGTYIYDENGNPYIDDEGNPEKAYYDFSHAKMYSTEVRRVGGDTDTFEWR